MVRSWRKLHSEELRNLYSSPNIIGNIKEDEMGSACSMNREKMNAYRILVGKPEKKRPLGRARRSWKVLLRWILEKQDGVIWTGFIWLAIGTSRGPLSTW
jgi:hypothetical protein